MNKKILIFALLAMFALNVSASFPVNKKNVEKTILVAELEKSTMEDAKVVSTVDSEITLAGELSPAAAAEDEGFIITLLLWLFLGGLAGHRWYNQKPTGWNILFILTLGGFGVWWIVDGINILTKNF